jgi:hypothetical protein
MEIFMPPTPALGLRRLPADVAQWLRARAAAEERSLAFIVARLIREQMAREAKTKKPKR